MPRPLIDSPFIFGIHEPGGEQHMLQAGCPGWIVFTESIGHDPEDRSGVDYTAYSERGLGIVARLNHGYEPDGTLPHSSLYADFARRVANFVAASPGCKLWVIGNEMNPNGGFLSRFPGLNLPSLGIPFYGPTPEDSFPVANYMLEYDGFADFPQYPGNFLSSLNAALGIGFVHGTYLQLTPEQLATAIELPTSSETQKYYVIPTENLPLLAPLRAIPVIGAPIADLLQPALRVIVNLGYGDPKYGWSQGLANVETPFGVFPDVDWGETIQLFFEGVAQGVNDFVSAVSPGGSMWQELSTHATGAVTALAALPTLTADGIIPAIQNTVTTVTEFISNAAASLYAALLPTADIVNAIVTILPGYAVNIFLEGIEQVLSGDILGGLINALGRPVAASIGLVTTAALIEVLVIGNAITGIFTLE